MFCCVCYIVNTCSFINCYVLFVVTSSIILWRFVSFCFVYFEVSCNVGRSRKVGLQSVAFGS